MCAIVLMEPSICRYVKSGDQTDILRAGYWPSYNIAFYEDIYSISGYRDAVELHGTEFSYQLCPRAEIFRRDQGKVGSLLPQYSWNNTFCVINALYAQLQVTDMESMKYIMRYNDYKNDIYSKGDPMNTICSRGDMKNEPASDGCYDTKVDLIGYWLQY